MSTTIKHSEPAEADHGLHAEVALDAASTRSRISPRRFGASRDGQTFWRKMADSKMNTM